MSCFTLKRTILTIIAGFAFFNANCQRLLPFKLPDTGQTGSYTSTPGEDSDYLINPPSYTDNGDGTITDNNTLLMWQKTDGGEMTFEDASQYCKNLTLGGYNDWRLPTGIELLSINNYNNLNPALDVSVFTQTNAQYWWTSEKRADDSTFIWVVNAGGGIGAHPENETVSSGGTRIFCTRAVRDPISTKFHVSHYTDNGDGTITDNNTGLMWQKIEPADSMTWEEALEYSRTLSLGGKTDWRLPDIKELQSLNDVSLINPSFNKNYFTNITSGTYWSSTTLFLTASKAWDINLLYGIVSYNDKTSKENVLLVRGGMDNEYMNIVDVMIPGDTFEMGDHYGFWDPNHPSDELPIHKVKIDTFYIGQNITTNQQYLTFLNSSLLTGSIQVTNNKVHLTGDTNTLYYTYQYSPYFSIGYDGSAFSIEDFRSDHPVVGVMWKGAVAFCNWLSLQNSLQQCYNLTTWNCDFTQNGYRLPTEAEWEFAGRGGQYNPYYKYPWGNDLDTTKANWPNSGDPYEAGAYPFTTPVGFYDGTLKQKSDYTWPGSASTYQTSNGENGFGLYDMAGNVWEFINDWYLTNYYSISPYDNPEGPDSGSIMPDGKQYKGMRGGNWYNGDIIDSVNDGHSRVSNRDPSYYRGPGDPNGPWFHVSFRVARKNSILNGVNEIQGNLPETIQLVQNYPNPFNHITTIKYFVPNTSHVILKVSNTFGQEVTRLVDEVKDMGWYTTTWDGNQAESGVYICTCSDRLHQSAIKMILLK
jgi:formylglycine-generating enzyme required for sulfatase activity